MRYGKIQIKVTNEKVNLTTYSDDRCQDINTITHLTLVKSCYRHHNTSINTKIVSRYVNFTTNQSNKRIGITNKQKNTLSCSNQTNVD